MGGQCLFSGGRPPAGGRPPDSPPITGGLRPSVASPREDGAKTAPPPALWLGLEPCGCCGRRCITRNASRWGSGLSSSPMRVAWAVVVDVCCVLVFVVIGRASHTQGEALAGLVSTSWPFLCGLGVGWAGARAWRRPLALRPAGLAAWLCTVAFGMLLRVVAGQGTAVAFIIVALAFLGLFFLGWRLIA